eukprot:CAMPEP_0183316076 /NCGR_PEP_ID=MMETSP0160_2-20130417/53769_1 /TAXON_ID=2839 ORGANISM="Odontella Sinensis, Strain Grunow 1884" /NCGR_SAMPLE_ID=MMETSP0160_2 /ASSEMBLY_ACC=CAM_ASM_000250 /LENGTH=167 /DNA_ID=CAMNT_0025481781 /DNA_START=19 /DNA_END=522 /DNA_ORIENTATION=-
MTKVARVVSLALAAVAFASSPSPSSASSLDAAAAAAAADATSSSPPHRRRLPEDKNDENVSIDFFSDSRDVCKNSDAGTPDDYGPCDVSRFPDCEGQGKLICYNRVNRRDKFWPDKVPHYYIDYDRILCYPKDWAGYGGCSSCSPGRYCKSERRCILDEIRYPCADW